MVLTLGSASPRPTEAHLDIFNYILLLVFILDCFIKLTDCGIDVMKKCSVNMYGPN